jgi:hypothetical protein
LPIIRDLARLGIVAHAYDPSYSGGGDRKIPWEKMLVDPFSTIKKLDLAVLTWDPSYWEA